MMPTALASPVEDYMRDLAQVVPGEVEAVYLVGSPALADFSARQSNVDLVVVTSRPLGGDRVAQLPRVERILDRAHRPPGIWYTTWEVVADGPVDPGPRAASTLDTPLTRELLRADAVALSGPDWPVVAYDEGAFRGWCRRALVDLAARASGLMIMRREVAPLVLEAARLAQGAVTGRTLSKSEAGHTATQLVPPHFRRILTDAVGYRQGASTSMYWGPFERKYDARELIRQLVAAVDQA
ncbi:MAG: hypothetical protein JO337_04630 [Acidimicrobiales bacterium]|nr:hypothetical protein [Acidimicrobiales bacterium]